MSELQRWQPTNEGDMVLYSDDPPPAGVNPVLWKVDNYVHWDDVQRLLRIEAAARAVVESAGEFPSRPLYADIAALRAALTAPSPPPPSPR